MLSVIFFHRGPRALRLSTSARSFSDNATCREKKGLWAGGAGKQGRGHIGHIGHIGQATSRPTGYSAELCSCLCAGWRRLRDCWAKALHSSRDGSGSHSCRGGGREGRDAGFGAELSRSEGTGEGQSPVPVAGRVAAMAPLGLVSQCRAPGPPEAKPSVPAQPWVGALRPTVVGPVANTLCKRQGTCQRGTGDLKKDKGEGEGNHHRGLGTGRQPCSLAGFASQGPPSALFEAGLPQTPAAMKGYLGSCTPVPYYPRSSRLVPPGAKHCLYLVDTAHRRLFGTSDHIGANANDIHLTALWGRSDSDTEPHCPL